MNDNAYLPIMREGEILAGGMRLFRVDDEGRVIFEDRYRRRCIARGSDDVTVYLTDLLDIITRHYQERT